ncbi:hypothetical protein [Streptomyces griseocarneus]|uniref:hypothetical protein n=1 Tax=Streptomyces griseocarneus TaxID=51201 RepID=UPI00167ED6A3|nr:hypothetical protein [Streptomyces griseocarneus]MBZ6474368.1 hypothetical protein [Streptomyces griseocarneus]
MTSGVDGEPDPEYAEVITQLYEDGGALLDTWPEFHRAFVGAAQQVMRSRGV